ncbi:MAG: hypothetical protein ACYTG0_35430 [Planctomycetota bacterium]
MRDEQIERLEAEVERLTDSNIRMHADAEVAAMARDDVDVGAITIEGFRFMLQVQERLIKWWEREKKVGCLGMAPPRGEDICSELRRNIRAMEAEKEANSEGQ